MLGKIVTSCSDCIFSLYNDNTQISCKFARLKVHEKNVVEAYDKIKEFYVLNNILCKYKRTKDWQWSSCDFCLQQEKINEENSLKYQVFIDANGKNIPKLKECLISLVKQTLPPQKIIIITPTYRDHVIEMLMRWLRGNMDGIKWEIRNSTNAIESFIHAVNLAMEFPTLTPNLGINFYATIQPQMLEPDLFSKINQKMLNDDLKFYVLTKNNQQFLSWGYVHKLFKADKTVSLLEKIKDKYPKYIIKLEDLE